MRYNNEYISSADIKESMISKYAPLAAVLGVFSAAALLIGGCMLIADASHNPSKWTLIVSLILAIIDIFIARYGITPRDWKISKLQRLDKAIKRKENENKLLADKREFDEYIKSREEYLNSLTKLEREFGKDAARTIEAL